MSLSAIAYGFGLLLLFISERLLGGDAREGASVWILRGLAALCLGASIVLRLRLIRSSEGTTKSAHKKALLFGLVGLAGLGLYLLSTEFVVDSLALQTEAARRWSGVLGALWPILILISILPQALLDRAIMTTADHLHPRRLQVALEAGLILALAIASAFPLNVIAHRFNHRSDQRYLKTTAVGEATLALASSLDAPLRVVLFFPPSSEVKRKLLPYFETLAQSSDKISLEQADQALDPELAKELRISSNGSIALVKGKDSERLTLGTSLDGASKSLKKLDQMVLEHLQKLSSKARVVYVTSGHGEAKWVGAEQPELRKISGLKQILERMNYRVKSLTLDTGLGREIPTDAAVVMIPGPRHPFLPEEIAALRRYRDGGGRLLLLLDKQPLPGPLQVADPDPALANLLGVSVNPAIVHHPKDHLVKNRSPSDQALLATNAYSTHSSVSTLARYKGQLIFLAPLSASVTVRQGEGELVTPTLRTRAGAFLDLDGNHIQDPKTEQAQTFVLGAAWEKRDSKARGAVLGSLAALSDGILRNQANQQYFYDTLRWIMGEEKLSGTVENEEDVRIDHTRDQDKIWFYGTSLLVPALLVLLGLLRVGKRRKRS